MEKQLLQQCQQWHEQNLFGKIIDALENLEERSATLDSELARAYNNQADHTTKEGRELLQKAVALLLKHEESMQDNALWHYRLAYAYYYLEQEHQALEHFIKAHELDSADPDAPMFIDYCQKELTAPVFQYSHTFAQRCCDAWQHFSEQEPEIRKLVDSQEGVAAINLCQELLSEAIEGISLELGKHQELYELILTPEGALSDLFALVYLCHHAPAKLKEHWSFILGRQALPNIALKVENKQISADDVLIYLKFADDQAHSYQIDAYCPKLAHIEHQQAWWMLTTLTDVVLGEIANMRYIENFELATKQLPNSIKLSELPQELNKRGCDLNISAEHYLDNSYISYQCNNPSKDSEAPLRKDIVVGSSRFPGLISQWMEHDHEYVQSLHNNGIGAGFIFFPIENLEQGMQWRSSLERDLSLDDAQENLCLIGGALGLNYGYIDFIAWDMERALYIIKQLGQKLQLPWIKFQTFRQDIESINVLRPMDEDKHYETGKFLGFVLLEQEQFNQEQLLADLKEQWDIVPTQERDEEDDADTLFIRYHDFFIVLGLMRGVVPNNEAEHHARRNYLWPQAESQVQKHQAHLVVSILGNNTDPIECGLLFTKVAATCLRQEGALGLYTNGTVFAPDFYQDLAQVIKGDELPINNWIWFGIWYNSQNNRYNAYTQGLRSFGKLEMEVLDVDADPKELREFLCKIAHYVIAQDVILHDGETIGFSAEDKHTITQSRGSYSDLDDQDTLKISFSTQESLLANCNYELADISYDYTFDKAQGLADMDDFVMDEAYAHIESIEDKELNIDPINAYNHLAIFLRWCKEHQLLAEDFVEEHPDLALTDLRVFIRDELRGALSTEILNNIGRAFAHYYYDCADYPYYPADVDQYATALFGYQRAKEEFKDEAYLFIEFNEDYYQGLSAIISKTFTNWQGQAFDNSVMSPNKLEKQLISYLNCPCLYFPPMKDDDPIYRAYHYHLLQGKEEGYVPVLIHADETLMECLTMDFDADENFAFNAEKVAAYRKEMCATILRDGAEVLKQLKEQYCADLADDEITQDEWLGTIAGGKTAQRFVSYWNYQSEFTKSVILAKIPVAQVWQIFAYLPFGGWNECPDTLVHMAVAKYWYHKLGAIPAVISSAELEFYLPQPLDKEQALQTAQELYGYCPDMDQNFDSAGALADTLTKSNIIYIWWD